MSDGGEVEGGGVRGGVEWRGARRAGTLLGAGRVFCGVFAVRVCTADTNDGRLVRGGGMLFTV